MKRREALGLLLALPVVAGCGNAYRSITAASEGENSLTVNVSDLRNGEGGFHSALLIRSRKFTYPIFLFRDETGDYSAFLAECTHKGCELQLEGTVLACPCHGSEFGLDGKVVNGPASKNLHQFRVASGGNNLHIYLS